MLPTFALRIVDDIVEERQVAVRKVRRFRRPIVHLHIDVVVHVRVPRRIVAVVPNTLQVVGQRHCTATRRDAEVSTIVEVELFEEQTIGCVAVVGRCAIIVHQVLGIALRSCTFEMEGHATHIRLVVGNVGRFDGFKRFLRSIVHESGDARVEVFCSTFGARGKCRVERRTPSENHQYFVRAFHHNTVSSSRHCPTHGHHFEARVVEDGGQFSCKPARTIGSILCFLRFERIARDEGELQIELVGALCFVECRNHTIGL